MGARPNVAERRGKVSDNKLPVKTWDLDDGEFYQHAKMSINEEGEGDYVLTSDYRALLERTRKMEELLNDALDGLYAVEDKYASRLANKIGDALKEGKK
jgi:hypothetical protein